MPPLREERGEVEMRAISGLVCVLALLYGAVRPATAQHIFLDTNGDGVHSTADRLSPIGSTRVDIWLQTDQNRDTSTAISALRDGVPLSIFSYEFILHAVGGTVEWGAYENLLSSMPDANPSQSSPSYFYTGFGGLTVHPPGKYRLGSMIVRVKSGSPQLQFVSSAPRWLGVQTSFGSLCPGKDRNHTLRFTEDRQLLGNSCEDIAGDWADADGVGVSSAALAGAAPASSASGLAFSVRVTPNPMNPVASLTVTTTRPGFLRIQLYSPDGRLVRTLRDEPSAPAGTHAVRVDARSNGGRALASGVYFYSVEATEGTASGRIVVAK